MSKPTNSYKIEVIPNWGTPNNRWLTWRERFATWMDASEYAVDRCSSQFQWRAVPSNDAPNQALGDFRSDATGYVEALPVVDDSPRSLSTENLKILEDFIYWGSVKTTPPLGEGFVEEKLKTSMIPEIAKLSAERYEKQMLEVVGKPSVAPTAPALRAVWLKAREGHRAAEKVERAAVAAIKAMGFSINYATDEVF